MVGKKNLQESTSKSARAGKKKEEAFLPSADLDRIIPLAGGTFAYLRDPRTGRTHHLKVGSEAWGLLLSELLDDPTCSHRIQSELEKLRWAR